MAIIALTNPLDVQDGMTGQRAIGNWVAMRAGLAGLWKGTNCPNNPVPSIQGFIFRTILEQKFRRITQ